MSGTFQDELHNRMLDVINDYMGDVSLIEVLGIMELVKSEVKEDFEENSEVYLEEVKNGSYED